jgi:hypothetical protein
LRAVLMHELLVAFALKLELLGAFLSQSLQPSKIELASS